MVERTRFPCRGVGDSIAGASLLFPLRLGRWCDRTLSDYTPARLCEKTLRSGRGTATRIKPGGGECRARTRIGAKSASKVARGPTKNQPPARYQRFRGADARCRGPGGR